MESRLSVREAMVSMGLALWQEDRPEEGAKLLRRALDAGGDEPPEWEIHYDLGRILASRADGPAALSSWVAAVCTAPPGVAGAPAAGGLDLLSDREASVWARWLPPENVAGLIRRAGANAAEPDVVRLAARLAYLRGDATASSSLLEAASCGSPADDPLSSAMPVARAHAALDDGRPEDALELLDGAGAATADPLIPATRALAHFAAGRLERAAGALVGVTPSFDTAVVETIIWLRQASLAGFGNRADDYVRADEAASVAARLDTGHTAEDVSQDDSLLLRAEVILEGALGLDEGRHLLKRALRRSGGPPDRIWWRVQTRVRADDEIFRYFEMEVAAARGNHREVLKLDESLALGTTEYAHDGAVHELVARALVEDDRCPEAGKRYRSGAASFTYADDLERALTLRERARANAPEDDDPTSIAELHWRLSFDRDDANAGEHVDRGLACLDSMPDRTHELLAAERAYIRGLLMVQDIDVRGRAGATLWEPLPWLLVASLSDPSHAYRAAHTAWALAAVRLRVAAERFADRAYALGENDLWLAETAVVARFNWHGRLTDADEAILDLIESDNAMWAATVRAQDVLVNGPIDRLEDAAADMAFDAVWARWGRAAAGARLHGPMNQREQLEAVLAEASEARGGDRMVDPSVAIDAALFLGDPARARAILRSAPDAFVAPTTVDYDALIDLVSAPPSAEDLLATVAAVLRETVRPVALKDIARVICPVLGQVYPDADPALTAVADAAEARLTAPTPPTMVEEVDAMASTSDTTTVDLVRGLVRIADLVDAGRAERAAELSGTLADRHAAHFGPELRRLAMTLGSRPVDA